MIIDPNTRNIKLTLSASCYRRLSTDSSICGITISRLIETVICDFCEWSGSIGAVNEKQRLNKIYDMISNGGEIRFFRSITRLLSGCGHRHSFSESKAYNWTVTSKARDALTHDGLTDSETYNFIADILEEYAGMNYSAREKIMLRDKIGSIEKAIRKSLIINYESRGGNPKKMIPYRIITEPDLQYNYLVGTVPGEDGTERIACARIFSMNGITITRTSVKTDNARIEQYISGRNIAYLWGEEKDIEIGLTPKGENNFDLIIHNRPLCTGRDEESAGGYRTYHFRCTEFQAEIYFRSFGCDAKVISPQSLAESIRGFYSTALKCAEENSQPSQM